jgi:hypothetical protein
VRLTTENSPWRRSGSARITFASLKNRRIILLWFASHCCSAVTVLAFASVLTGLPSLEVRRFFSSSSWPICSRKACSASSFARCCASFRSASALVLDRLLVRLLLRREPEAGSSEYHWDGQGTKKLQPVPELLLAKSGPCPQLGPLRTLAWLLLLLHSVVLFPRLPTCHGSRCR